jgi:hypothetical protein
MDLMEAVDVSWFGWLLIDGGLTDFRQRQQQQQQLGQCQQRRQQ